jgi:hypothetical protein
MAGFRAVTMPMEFWTSWRLRSRSAWMPLMQKSANARATLRRKTRLLNRLKAMIGSAMFSSNTPASAAMVTVTSLPMIS